MGSGPDSKSVPLCVDMDGTLLRTDMLHEALVQGLKNKPLAFFSLPGWLAQGKSRFKALVSELAPVDAGLLPYREEVLEIIAAAKSEGRPIILATASCSRIADAVAEHLGLFDATLCSDTDINLSSETKARKLVELYGERGFDYVGDSKADLAVFPLARKAYLVSASGRLQRIVAGSHGDLTVLDDRSGDMRTWLRALRIHQWLKNLLLFLPLLAAHQLLDFHLLTSATLAFLSFGLCASAVYIWNDILDLPSDRAHRSKSKRPFAAGTLSIRSGLIASVLLLLSSIAIAVSLPIKFLLVLAIYFVSTLSYSFLLKRQVIVDVMILAGLYSLRVVAGAAATNVQPSFWLLALSMFIFLDLALVKRYSELLEAKAADKLVAGRGYLASDLPLLLALGAASGMVSVLVLAMYTQAETVASMYPAPQWLWLAPPLMLYWTTRLWMKATRGEVHEDPVIFAMRDWQSLTVAALMGGVFVIALSGLSFG